MVNDKVIGVALVLIAVALLARASGLEWLTVLLPVSLVLAFAHVRLGQSQLRRSREKEVG